MPQTIIGSYTLSNTSALVVYIDLNEGDVTSAFLSWDNPPQKKRRTKIYTSTSGRFYIRRYNIRYYLDEFIRV